MRRESRVFRHLVTALALCGAALAGDPAPDVSMQTQDGKTVKLSDYKGKQAVVLLFMRGFTGEFACFHCSKQTKVYKMSYKELQAAGAEVLMILPGAHDAKGYLEKVGTQDQDHPEPGFSVPFPVLLDPDASAARAFGIPIGKLGGPGFPVSNPTTVVVGKDGTIVYHYQGKNPSDRPTVDTVLAALNGAAAAPPTLGDAMKEAAKASLPWMSYEEGMKAAKEQKKPVLLDFYADW